MLSLPPPNPHPQRRKGSTKGGLVAPASLCTPAKHYRQSDWRENVCVEAPGWDGMRSRGGDGCGGSWHLRGADSRRHRGTEANSPSATWPVSPSQTYLALSRARARFWRPVPGLSAEKMGQGGSKCWALLEPWLAAYGPASPGLLPASSSHRLLQLSQPQARTTASFRCCP